MKNTFDLRKFLTENKIEENHDQLPLEVGRRIDQLLNLEKKAQFLKIGGELIDDHITTADQPDDDNYINDVVSHLANILSKYYKNKYLNEEEEDEIRDTDDHFHDDPLQDRINKLKDGEEIEETAPGYDHETYGYGLCLEGRHTLVETSKGRAKVTHYDVFFKNGSKIVENIPVEDLVIESIEEHYHGKRKK